MYKNVRNKTIKVYYSCVKIIKTLKPYTKRAIITACVVAGLALAVLGSGVSARQFESGSLVGVPAGECQTKGKSWQLAEKAQGRPETTLSEDTGFGPHNSSMWQGGSEALECGDFDLPQDRKTDLALSFSLSVNDAQQETIGAGQVYNIDQPSSAPFAVEDLTYLDSSPSSNARDSTSLDKLLRVSVSVDNGQHYRPLLVLDESMLPDKLSDGYITSVLPPEIAAKADSLSVKVEGLIGGETTSRVFLDSAFLTYRVSPPRQLSLAPESATSVGETPLFRHNKPVGFRLDIKTDGEGYGSGLAAKAKSAVGGSKAPDVDIDTVLIGPGGEKLENVGTEVVWRGKSVDGTDQWGITFKQPTNLKPGIHTAAVTVTDSEGNSQSVEQNFLWGVLALNTHKSMYKAEEMVNFDMSVLDETGEMVCDAELKLEITGPSNTTLSTADGSITVNDECQIKGVTDKPDYEAGWQIPKLLLGQHNGEYELNLTAKTANGEYSIRDSFQVGRNEKVLVERSANTRIMPVHDYDMDFKVTPREDFNGTVTETVPESFKISNESEESDHGPFDQAGMQVSATENGTKEISWDVSLSAGETYEFGYTYDAPNVSPEFWLLGPLTFSQNNKTIFKEHRQWQIASDAVNNIVPNGDFSANWPILGGTNDSSCSGSHCSRVDEGSTPDTADYVGTGTNGDGAEVEEFDMGTLTTVDEATSVTLYMYAQSATNANGGTLDDVDMNIHIGGTYQTAVTKTPSYNSWAWHSATFTGSWTQADIDAMRAQFTRTVQGGGQPAGRDDDVRIAAVYAEVTYSQTTTFDQSAYRWFGNQDDTIGNIDFSQTGTTSTIDLDSARDVYVSSGYAYVASAAADSLTVIDISDPTNPVQTGTISTIDLDSARDVYVSSGYAYVASFTADSLTAIDISDPTNPTQAGTISTVDLDGARGVYVSGSYAYVSSNTADSLTAIDISDPTDPTQAGTISTTDLNAPRGVYVSGSYAYVTGRNADSLTVIDISDPTNPTQAGTISTVDLDSAWDVHVANGYAYVTSSIADSLTAIDISDPTNLVQADTISTTDLDGASGVHVANGYAYIASDTADSLTAIDISDPTNLVQAGTISTVDLDGARGAHVANGYAYVASYAAESLTAVNISESQFAQIGSPLASQDTAATAPSQGTPFRLRMNTHVSNAELAQSGQSFKLQYAEQGTDNACDTGFSGETYSDVDPASGAIRYYDNTNIADGDFLDANADDPVHSGHTNVRQTYNEANNFTNAAAAIPAGQDGMWDFALVDNSAPAGTSYCFRAVKSDGSVLNTYSTVPEITTAQLEFEQSAYRWFENQDISSDWYNSAWSSRKKLTIDATKVPSDQTNFPVLVDLAGDADLAAKAQGDFDDILFAASDGVTKLSHEIESYNSTNGDITAWVNVPTVSGAANTDIYLYYGNEYADNQEDITGVWDSNYGASYHKKDITTSTIKDSTVNDNNGNKVAADNPQEVSGKISLGQQYNGTSSVISVANHSSMVATNSVTISAWIYPTANGQSSRSAIAGKMNSQCCAYEYGLRQTSSNEIDFDTFDIETGDEFGGSNTAVELNTWTYVSATYNGSEKKIYLNGELDATYSASGSLSNTGQPFSMGAFDDTYDSTNQENRRFQGSIDEVRMSINSRSADWIKTEYNNQNSPSTFYSVGAEEVLADASPLAAQDTATTAPSQGTPFRLRMNAHVSNAELAQSGQSFKLQYAEQGTDNACDTGFSGETYSDVESTTAGSSQQDPTTATNVGTGGSWSNPTNVQSSDDSHASTRIGTDVGVNDSTYLEASGFNFSLPESATVSGIEVTVERRNDTAFTTIEDLAVRIVKGGAIGATDKSSGDSWPSTDTAITYGSSTDLWGETWTASDINASNFGFAIRATTSFGDVTALIDHIQITVHYSVEASGDIIYYDNTNIADGDFLDANADDPVHSGHTNVRQTYNEANNFTNAAAAIPAGQDGMWDFALVDNSAPAGTSYCFRAVKSDGSVLNTYSTVPEVETSGSGGNTAPNDPASLAQLKTDDTAISTNGWTNETSVKFSASASDPDSSDTLRLCVEVAELGTGFTNSETACGSGVAYSGSDVTTTVTLSGLSDPAEYHWQARIKDSGGAYSGWVSYGGNAESARDFGIDTTAPTGGNVYDGTTSGVDVSFNDGSLSEISANWADFNFDASGIDRYEYSVGTTQGGTEILGWTGNATTTSVTATGLSLRTSQIYYFNIRAIDNAGNVSMVSSDGQFALPTLSFSVAPTNVTFNNLNSGNSYTDTDVTALTTSTNAYAGYVVRAHALDLIKSTSGASIPWFDGGSYASPDSWQSGDRGYGYTSDDTSIQGVNKFQSDPCLGGSALTTPGCYAPFSTTSPGDIVADNTDNIVGTPITDEIFNITHRVTVDPSQPADTYNTTIIYTVTAEY